MKPIQDLVAAVRAVVKAHAELKRVYADEGSPRAKKAKQKALRDALEGLVGPFVAFERALAESKARPKDKGQPFPWGDFLRTGMGIVEMVVQAQRQGAASPMGEVIDAEVVE